MTSYKNKEMEASTVGETEAGDSDLKWKRIKPYYVLLLIYAGILIMGLIFRLCI